MKTYQDYLELGKTTDTITLANFVRNVVDDHKSTELYKIAAIAEEYDAHRNTTINKLVKLIYTVTGKPVVDTYSSNNRLAVNCFHRFVVQEVQYLLGNGVTWTNPELMRKKLGSDFDARLQELGKYAIVEGLSFGFFNVDHINVFKATEFAPLFDEENGALMAGVRFWQVAPDRPLRATFYELDGYTDFIWLDNIPAVLHKKRPYILKMQTTVVDGTEIYDFDNYPTFPVVPLWGNSYKQSKLVGLREKIDCYDIIQSGFADDVTDAAMVYWTLNNAGGMGDADLAKFVERIKTVKAAAVDQEGVNIQSHTMDVPYGSREAILSRLMDDLYRDAMALDTENIAGGAVTATQIKAAYEPLDSECDDLEYCVLDFMDRLFKVAGIEGEKPSFTRSRLVNTNEEINNVLAAADHLSSDYVTRKILTLLGDGDKADDIISEMEKESQERISSNKRQPELDADGTTMQG